MIRLKKITLITIILAIAFVAGYFLTKTVEAKPPTPPCPNCSNPHNEWRLKCIPNSCGTWTGHWEMECVSIPGYGFNWCKTGDKPDDLKGKKDCRVSKEDYYECPTEGNCPTQCGQPASEVPDGAGGTKVCPATAECPLTCEEQKRRGYSGEHECGWSPEVSPQEKYEPPKCTVALPVRVDPKTMTRIDADTVRVTWEADDTNTTHWALNYGYNKDNLPYGIPYLPKEARSVDINGLGSGHVWFELWRFNGNECAVWGNRIDP